MLKFLSPIVFLLICSIAYSQDEKVSYYYCAFQEQPTTAKYNLDENFRPKAYYTFVIRVKGNCIDTVNDKGIENVFFDFLKAKYGNDLPYGEHYSRVFNNRKEAVEERLKDLGELRNYHNYILFEIEDFNYYCN